MTVPTTPPRRQPALALPFARHDPEDVVAVEHSSGLVGEDRAVRVAVERDAHRGAGLAGPPRHRLRMERAAAMVDVSAVRPDGHRRDARAGPREGRRTEVVGRAVARVDDDGETVQVGRHVGREPVEVGSERRGSGPAEGGRVGFRRAVAVAQGVRVGPRASRRIRSSDSSSSSGHLRPSGPKIFTPLSSYGLCEAETETPGSRAAGEDELRDARRRHDAGRSDGAAALREPFREPADHRPRGFARVAAENDRPSAPGEHAAAELACRSASATRRRAGRRPRGRGARRFRRASRAPVPGSGVAVGAGADAASRTTVTVTSGCRTRRPGPESARAAGVEKVVPWPSTETGTVATEVIFARTGRAGDPGRSRARPARRPRGCPPPGRR